MNIDTQTAVAFKVRAGTPYAPDMHTLLGFAAPDWMQDAVCAQIGDDFWFPEKGGSCREPKKVCASCPVIAECLAYALANQERFGVWGGKSERERRKMAGPEPVAAEQTYACRRCEITYPTKDARNAHWHVAHEVKQRRAA